jgi:hypothetical protein
MVFSLYFDARNKEFEMKRKNDVKNILISELNALGPEVAILILTKTRPHFHK